MDDIYFVIADNKFCYEGREASMIKCPSMDSAKRLADNISEQNSSIRNIYIAKCVSHYRIGLVECKSVQ